MIPIRARQFSTNKSFKPTCIASSISVFLCWCLSSTRNCNHVYLLLICICHEFTIWFNVYDHMRWMRNLSFIINEEYCVANCEHSLFVQSSQMNPFRILIKNDVNMGLEIHIVLSIASKNYKCVGLSAFHGLYSNANIGFLLFWAMPFSLLICHLFKMIFS